MRSERYEVPDGADSRLYLGEYRREHKDKFKINEGQRIMSMNLRTVYSKHSTTWWANKAKRNAGTPNNSTQTRQRQSDQVDEDSLLTDIQKSSSQKDIVRLLNRCPSFNSDPKIWKPFGTRKVLFGGPSKTPTASAECPICAVNITLPFRKASFNIGNLKRHYTKIHMESDTKGGLSDKGGASGVSAPKKPRQVNNETETTEAESHEPSAPVLKARLDGSVENSRPLVPEVDPDVTLDAALDAPTTVNLAVNCTTDGPLLIPTQVYQDSSNFHNMLNVSH
ncbi:hypothetical protein QAD02_007120 [Eretmocerus hayati]|uniref:Uncharacterized protein n=1 Tax=Eretmocerus hayati TaxID=131215 RepID=A0ACC2N3A8_9HYME|nr:hypothetical protein QAD02_007120 [Eretmocerus hayati]